MTKELKLTPADVRALSILVTLKGWVGPGHFGSLLWGTYRGSECSAPYARQAGKVLRRLERAGLSRWQVEGERAAHRHRFLRWGWEATREGHAFIERNGKIVKGATCRKPVENPTQPVRELKNVTERALRRSGPQADGGSDSRLMLGTTKVAPDGLGKLALDVVHNIDCLSGLKMLPSDSLDVVVTSPPYWGQRGSGGLGSEADPREYIRNLTAVLAEAMRCLKPSGTLWLNIGDAYNTPINWREDDHAYSSLGKDKSGLSPTNSAYTKNRGRRRAFIDRDVGWLQYGNLLAVPYRMVIAMTDAGFLFRGEVIWEKSRPLPEGVCRRPHRRHEGIYIFAKTERHAFRVRPPVGSVWRLLQTPNSTPHCSTFPLDLPVQCIKAAGLELPNAVICDPFMGSGTTGRAALTLGHHFIGFELNADVCDMANEETSRHVQQKLSFG